MRKTVTVGLVRIAARMGSFFYVLFSRRRNIAPGWIGNGMNHTRLFLRVGEKVLATS